MQQHYSDPTMLEVHYSGMVVSELYSGLGAPECYYSGMHAARAYSARACAMTTYVLAASVLARTSSWHAATGVSASLSLWRTSGGWRVEGM